MRSRGVSKCEYLTAVRSNELTVDSGLIVLGPSAPDFEGGNLKDRKYGQGPSEILL